jgi:hypothetical protein
LWSIPIGLYILLFRGSSANDRSRV